MRLPLSAPADAGPAGDLARQLARLVGPAVQAPDGSLAACEYLALGEGLADSRATTLAAIAEALPQSADDLLAEWEAHLAVPIQPQDTAAARQARLLARLRAAGGTPQRLVRSTTTLAASGCTITEYLYSDVAALDARLVFRFVVTVPAALWTDVEFRTALDELLARQTPAHVTWNVATSVGFKFGDTAAGFGRGVWT